MKSREFFVAAALSLTLAAGAGAQEAGAEKSAQDATKKVCRAQKELGSQIPKRVCRTRAEWDQVARDAEELMRQRDRSSHCSDGGRC